jgi:hypothetical protein
MDARYVRRQGVANAAIRRRGGMSNASFQRSLKADIAGGITQLKHSAHDRPPSALTTHRTTLAASFQPHPPARVAAAAANIAELPGLVRQPTQVRQD